MEGSSLAWSGKGPRGGNGTRRVRSRGPSGRWYFRVPAVPSHCGPERARGCRSSISPYLQVWSSAPAATIPRIWGVCWLQWREQGPVVAEGTSVAVSL